MTTQHAMLPQMETLTVDAMNRVVTMFAALTDKHLTSNEGYQFLSLWGMVNKTAASATALVPPQPAAPAPQAPAAPAEPVTVPVMPSHAPAPAVTETAAPAPVSKAVPAPEPVRETMPPVEEIRINGIEQPLRRVPESFRNDSRYWVPGYNWKILVEPFDHDGEMQAYYVHYRHKPTQEEFAEHYKHFTAKENRCRVHVMESDGQGSTRITDEYCRFHENDELNYGTKETLHPNDKWEENARFRARFADKRLNGQINYIYFANKPSKAQIDGISVAKGVVLVEKRPDLND